ncbi:unnamed protein product [Lepeophtheirus salmonis]|uniref:(salmon louse) hypothetical protein n=1 Tax=Lepeophtheirus salmonis TaxID=72036 RepID=A0A7R8H1A4_LEPSM|nr:unnamed protein product [Lepeophtheirus salmonis]CAF2805747.1 unnamed protein product [Lepeophtheirus salmonis]
MEEQFIEVSQSRSDLSALIERKFGWYRELSEGIYYISVRQIQEAEKNIRTLGLARFSGPTTLEIKGLLDEDMVKADLMDALCLVAEEYMEIDNFDKALLTPSANSKNRKSNSYDGQVHILKYIITHGKYNSLKDINTLRRMKVGGVCSGLRTAISLKEHFRKQILPHINIKTYTQFSEEDLNKILRGWKGSKTSFNVEVLERSSRLKQNVPCSDDAAMHKQANVKIENSVGSLQKSSRKLINKDKTHFDESFGILNKKEEVTAIPSYKRIKICNLNKLEASSTPIQKYFVKESQDCNTLWLSQTDVLKSKEHEAFSKTYGSLLVISIWDSVEVPAVHASLLCQQIPIASECPRMISLEIPFEFIGYRRRWSIKFF